MYKASTALLSHVTKTRAVHSSLLAENQSLQYQLDASQSTLANEIRARQDERSSAAQRLEHTKTELERYVQRQMSLDLKMGERDRTAAVHKRVLDNMHDTISTYRRRDPSPGHLNGCAAQRPAIESLRWQVYERPPALLRTGPRRVDPVPGSHRGRGRPSPEETPHTPGRLTWLSGVSGGAQMIDRPVRAAAPDPHSWSGRRRPKPRTLGRPTCVPSMPKHSRWPRTAAGLDEHCPSHCCDVADDAGTNIFR